jgi:hypothetical protein
MNNNILKIEPLKLFNYKRWDVLIKYVYLKYLVINIGIPDTNNITTQDDYFNKINDDNDFKFFRNLYINHLKILNGGVEEKTFFQQVPKDTPEQFLDDFHNLWYDIAINDFNLEHPIPINGLQQILNGAHRLSIGLILKKEVPIQQYNNITQPTLEILPELFSDRIKYQTSNPNSLIPRRHNKHNNVNQLSKHETDFLFLEYVELRKKYLRIMVCFQSQIYNDKKNQDFLNDFFKKKNYDVVHTSRITFTNYGIINLIKLLYHNNQKVNIYLKRDLCYSKPDIEEKIDDKINNLYYTTFVLLEQSNAKFKNISDSGSSDKMEIRNFLGKYDSIHVSDNQDDTLQLAKLIFNQNSIDFINYTQPFKHQKLLERCIKFNTIINNNYQYIIVSSSILNLLGVREANDLDYLILDISNKNNNQNNHKDNHKDNHKNNEFYNKLIEKSHLSQLKYYSKSIFDMIANPNNFFYFLDYKFQNLQLLHKFKKKRNEIPKDINDIKLIETFNHIKNIIPELTIIIFLELNQYNFGNNPLETLIYDKFNQIYNTYHQLQFFDNYFFIEIENNIHQDILDDIKSYINHKYPNIQIKFLTKNQDNWTQRILIYYLQICNSKTDRNQWLLYLNINHIINHNINHNIFDLEDIWKHLSKLRIPSINYLELVSIPNNKETSINYLQKFFKNSHHIVKKTHMSNFFWSLIKKYYLESISKNKNTNITFHEILDNIYQKDIKNIGEHKIHHEWKSYTYFY